MIGSFRQHTSRDGDPQLHVHNLVLNKVQTERDGKWRKLDSRSLYRFQGAAAAIAAAVTETALTREFGVAWVPRADGHGREIAGISQELMDAFSSRRQTITPEARKVAAEREAETGRRPDARQMYRIQKDIAYRTRARKPEAPLDIRAKLREWEQTAREKDLGELAAIPGAVAEAARQARERALEQAEQDAPAEAVLRVARAIGWEFARQHGRAPDADEFRRIERFARFITLNGADTRPVEPALLLRGWQAQERADARGAVSDPARDRPGASPLRPATRTCAGAGAGGGVPRTTARFERGSGAVPDGRGDRGHPGADTSVDQGGPDPLPGRGASRPGRWPTAPPWRPSPPARSPARPGNGWSCCPRRNGRASPTGCAARTANRCSGRTAPNGTPARRSSPSRNGSWRRRRNPARRTWTPRWRRGCSARTWSGSRRSSSPEQTPRRWPERPGAGCGWIRLPPPGTC